MALPYSKLAFTTGIALFVASCGIYLVDGELRNLSIRYSEPNITAENGSLLRIGDDYTQSFREAQQNLRAAGFDIISAHPQTGQIEISSTINKTVDCGEMAIGEIGDARFFAANVSKAAIEIPIERSSGFALREVAVNSSATIMIGVDSALDNAVFASISENHRVSISVQAISDETPLYAQTRTFSGNDTAHFQRGVVCGSARYVREILSAG